ncbi:hypothetical protein U9R90_18760 [Streptomyces sp. E11-3]|uniref:hypothetical protein n=1 Tax=Streptomyces sp. E11-3 TaxID=3110112 RepID=UPI003980B53E
MTLRAAGAVELIIRKAMMPALTAAMTVPALVLSAETAPAKVAIVGTSSCGMSYAKGY